MNADRYSAYGAGLIAGRGQERERIIKLLEEQKTSDEAAEASWQGRDWNQVEHQQDDDALIDELIALIKGENK